MKSIEIPLELHSQNVLRRRFRNPHAYRRLREGIGWMLVALRVPHELGVATPEMEARAVTITRLLSGRKKKYDPGNLVGGAKPLIDELVRCRVLIDDAEEWAAISYAQERGECDGVRIEVEE